MIQRSTRFRGPYAKLRSHSGLTSTCAVTIEIGREVGLEKMMDDGEVPNEEDWGPLGSHKYTLKVSFTGDEVVLENSGVASEEPSPNAGTYTLKQLVIEPWTELINLH